MYMIVVRANTSVVKQSLDLLSEGRAYHSIWLLP